MDRVDQNVESRFKIEKMESAREHVTERLDTTPHDSVLFPGEKIVEFGNTGFKINFSFSRYNFDFVPEGVVAPLKEDKAKHASMLGVSLMELHRFLNNPVKMSELGINDSDVNTISNKTNSKLRNSITKLFSRSDSHWLATTYGDVVKINLKGFRDLKSDDPLIVFLTNVSERAKDTTVTYYKTVEQS